jgi:hypothetical protein
LKTQAETGRRSMQYKQPEEPTEPPKRWSLRKTILISVAAVVVLFLMADGVYWLRNRSNDQSSDVGSKVNTKYNGPTKDPDALPPVTGPNALDAASLKQDLTSLNAATMRGSDAVAATTTALEDTPIQLPDASASLSTLKQKGDDESERRLAVLNALITLLSSSSNISIQARNDLSNEVGNEVTNLVILRGQLREDTDASSAAEKVAQLDGEYTAFALLGPKVRLVKTADNQLVAVKSLEALQKKLVTRIEGAPASSKAALTAKLDDLKTHTAVVRMTATDTLAAVLPLQPTTLADDHSRLSDYRTELKNAQDDLQTAASLAASLVSSLK